MRHSISSMGIICHCISLCYIWLICRYLSSQPFLACSRSAWTCPTTSSWARPPRSPTRYALYLACTLPATLSVSLSVTALLCLYLCLYVCLCLRLYLCLCTCACVYDPFNISLCNPSNWRRCDWRCLLCPPGAGPLEDGAHLGAGFHLLQGE